jgi:PhnB protein
MNFILSAAIRQQSPTQRNPMETMMKLNPYLTFNGQCKEAMEFYAKALRGQVVMMMKNGDMPAGDQMPGAAPDLIMHARIVMGDQVLMASDATADCHVDTRGMMVSTVVETPAEAERIYGELSAGGQITMPMAETFWAHRFGMFTDRFGIPWMVNCEKSM